MFNLRPVIVLLCLASSLAFTPDGFASETKQQPAGVISIKKQRPHKRGAGRSYSVTCGYHQVNSGWQNSVIKRDPNLPHWSWLAMQEADKRYIRVAPGSNLSKRGNQANHYPRPIHVPVGNRGPDSHYVKPIHAPLPAISTTAIKLRSAGDSTRAKLLLPKAKIPIISTSTGIKVSAPATSVKLAKNQMVQNSTVGARLAPVSDAFSSDALNGHKSVDEPVESADTDEFQSGKSAVSPYGTAHRHASGSAAAALVHGKVLKNKSGLKH